VLVDVLVDVVVASVAVVDELVLVDVLVDVVVASVVVVDEIVEVLVDVLVLVDVVVVGSVVVVVVVVDNVVVVVDNVVVVGPVMVSVPAVGEIVIVSGPLCASMLAGVNVNMPLAAAVNAPTLICRISPCPFPMTTPPVPVSKAMRIVPLEQSIACSSGCALVRGWQPPVVQAEQLALEVHDVPPFEQSDVHAINDEVTILIAVGSASVAQKLGLKFTLKASVVRSGPV
jgi:hypothetical protein